MVIHKLLRSIAIVIVAGASLTAVARNGYCTDMLQRMASCMNVKAKLDTLSEGEYYRYFVYNNRPVTVIVKNGEVAHIGYSVFTLAIRHRMASPVCNFLERYALEITLPLKREKSVARQLDEDGIFFHGGDFSYFKQIESDTTFAVNLENLNNKRYTVSWLKDGETKFSVNFPIEHDLIAGTDMIENERRILANIPKASKATRHEQLADSARLRLSWQGKYYTLPGNIYYTKQLNTNRYYMKDKKDGFKLFYHPSYVLESLSNLMTTVAIENDYDLQIRLLKYGFVQDTIQVKLNQWLNYCFNEGCIGYFGIIGEDNGIADCELIMRNSALGYIHLMRLSIDVTTLEERKGLIKARLNSYITTTRVKYLFDELKI